MTNEVEWVIDQLASVVSAQPAAHPLRRVNRDVPFVYDPSGSPDKTSPEFDVETDAEACNIVSVGTADRANSYAGSDPDVRVEQTVAVRIEGHTALGGAFGHIDPTGAAGVEFTGDGSLVDQVTSAIYDGLKYPDTGRPNTTYCDLRIENETDLSRNYRDAYRYDFDVRFTGFEEL
jgi:hypothetical protein